MAQFTSLYSGSSGNCSWVEENNQFLLVDMGKTCKQTVQSLEQLNCLPKQLAGILITHEHIDHIKGITVFLKQYNVPVYGMADTLNYLTQNDLVPTHTKLVAVDNGVHTVAGFTVSAFKTSHDSVACCGYEIVSQNAKKLCLATDLGYVSEEILQTLLQADIVSLEANYDQYMLMSGKYPGYLKARIASNKGHLCNLDTAKTVVKLIENGCKQIALCHISNENNTPQLALQAVQAALMANNICPQPDVVVQTLARHSVSPIFQW